MLRRITIRFFSTKADPSVAKIPIKPKPIKKPKAQGYISDAFVDIKKIKIKAGKGGDGLVSFLHTKETEWGGPDGGDGGNGGHVIFQADKNLKSLNKIKTLYQAENGEDGKAFHMKGKSGEHLVIKVPVGTNIKNEVNEILIEFTDHEEKYIAAHGGAGGKGNYYFLTNDNKEPMESEPGNIGENKNLELELKLIADAGLIGLPNVGKSSLLNALTRARTKVGDYAFTTLYPHVGVVEYEDMIQVSIADLPGVLPDLTRGLGIGFLRHLEKCKIILQVVDLSAEEPIKQYEDVKGVLEAYDKDIFEKKAYIIIGSKIDKENAMENLAKLKAHVKYPVIPISTTQKINITKFLIFLRSVYDQINENK